MYIIITRCCYNEHASAVYYILTHHDTHTRVQYRTCNKLPRYTVDDGDDDDAREHTTSLIIIITRFVVLTGPTIDNSSFRRRVSNKYIQIALYILRGKK